MPGTFGTLLGVGWLALLLLLPDRGWMLTAIVLSLPLGALVCTRTEAILDRHDPGCIVLDEILAFPVAALGWMAWLEMTGAGSALLPGNLWGLVLCFVLFRFFDIAKPWPVGWSQRLPRGWGILADDVLAGLYASLATFAGLLPFTA